MMPLVFQRNRELRRGASGEAAARPLPLHQTLSLEEKLRGSEALRTQT